MEKTIQTSSRRVRPRARWGGALLCASCALCAVACGGSGRGVPIANGTSGTSAGGGSSSAGAPTGNAGAGNNGSAGEMSMGTAGAFPVQMCQAGSATCTANTTLAAGAPALTVGMWKNISPTQVPFGNTDSNNPTFTQGVAVDPCNSSVLYLTVDGFDTVKSQAGLYKSKDAGSTWTRIARVIPNFTGVDHLDEPIRVRIDPKNSDHLYVVDGVRGGTTGFWVSCDGGENFTMPDAFATLQANHGLYPLDTYDIAVDPMDFNHALVTSHAGWGDKYGANSGLLETKDGGSNWIIHEPMDGWGTGHSVTFLYNPALKMGDSSTWLLSTQGATRWRTTDSGANWTKVSADHGIEHGGGTTYYDKKGTLYASGYPSNQRSSDNGVTWTAVGGGNGSTAIIGDGTTLYSAPALGPTTFFTSPESDGMTFAAFNAQQFQQGPFEMAYDASNKIMYSGTWLAGMWALKVQ